MTRKICALSLPLIVALTVPAIASTPSAAKVERIAPDKVMVSWTDQDAVDVYMADRPDASLANATLVSRGDKDGRHEMAVGVTARPYFMLRDQRDGGMIRVAERALPLEHGSNFRDIGGYPAAGGKHVRWGMIFRSGGTPLLNDADEQRIGALKLGEMVDLRSSEERVLAPTRIYGVRYTAVGYSMGTMSANMNLADPMQRMSAVYRDFPQQLVPQLRVLFDTLLAKKGPVVYNCSAGQDRTGFATAMIMSALGVPREVIYKDYLLSTGYRKPLYELPKIDPVAQADNPAAMFFVKYQQSPEAAKPKPLVDGQNQPFLVQAFDEVEKRWGSVDAYLEKAVGVSPVELASLRAAYLE